ncbi:hypothetical protein L209DRAFT_751589 [Thermothelomyces heterothallicus CBS 203.75]
MADRASGAEQGRTRTGSNASSTTRRLSQELVDSNAPEGLTAATSDVPSSVFSTYASPDGKASSPPGTTPGGGVSSAGHGEKHGESLGIQEPRASDREPSPVTSSEEATLTRPAPRENELTEPFENGYHFPPRYSWRERLQQGLGDFWAFFTTPMGCFWTIYGLNVVAWGGMIFLLLCNAAPAMCRPTCDDIESPRRKWIEWDAQILTALFCVTAFGLAPWRFRDLYFLLRYRVLRKHEGLRRLAGIHNGWFRLPGTQALPADVGPDNVPADVPRSCVPIPQRSMPRAPLTGTRAPATALWKLDFVIWAMVGNTFAQCGLCGIMWGMNRYDRPSWATGFLVAIACLVGMAGGLVMFLEGRRVKSIEGVPLTERDRERLARDEELGIPHYNNLKDKKPKEKGKGGNGKKY